MTLWALFARTVALFAFGAVLMAIGSRRQAAAVRRARTFKLLTFFVIVNGVVALAAAGRAGVVALAVTILAFSAWEGVRAWRQVAAPRPAAVPLVALALGAGFMVAALRLDPPVVAWIFMCSGAFDGFSQVTGQWLGAHPLAPRISPAKTIEGVIGGFWGAVCVAVWLRDLAGYGMITAIMLSAVISAASMSGDLAGSWTKRRAGIKDFSALLPGQGGVIDRFNSFVAAMAIVGPWL